MKMSFFFSQYLKTDVEYYRKLGACNKEQPNVFHLVDQSINTDQTSARQLHLFIIGGAGNGKSFLQQIMREYILRTNVGVYPNVIVAAPTGVTVFNIDA